MLFSILKNIPFKGTIEIVDCNHKKHIFGSNEPFSKIRLKTKIRNQQKTKGEGKKDLENPIGPLDYIKEKTTT